jgi:hypothetical protein
MRMVPCSQIPSVFNRWKNFFNQVLNVHGVHDVRQMDIHMAEPSVPEPSLVKVEIAIGKLKRYKSSGTDWSPAKLIKAGGETTCSKIHKLIHSVWNKEELSQQWKESVIVSNILLARLTPYVNEIIGDHQCRFSFNKCTTDQIFYICQILTPWCRILFEKLIVTQLVKKILLSYGTRRFITVFTKARH